MTVKISQRKQEINGGRERERERETEVEFTSNSSREESEIKRSGKVTETDAFVLFIPLFFPFQCSILFAIQISIAMQVVFQNIAIQFNGIKRQELQNP